jgi:hypothetical protein
MYYVLVFVGGVSAPLIPYMICAGIDRWERFQFLNHKH